MKREYLCFLVFLLFAFSGLYAIEDQVYLTISRKGSGKTPVGLMNTIDRAEGKMTGLTKECDNILGFDLSILGYFDVYRENELTEEEKMDKNHIKDDPSYHTRLRAVIFAYIEESRGGDISLYGFVRDPFSGERLISKKYSGPAKNFRRLVHTFSDDITYALTGEEGIANSKITAVWVKDNSKEIIIMDYDGRNMMQVTSDGSISSSPRLSDDQKQLVYISYKDGYPNLFLRNMETGDTRKITRSRYTKSSPAFSSDGKKIAFAMSINNNTDIYLIQDLSTKQAERITTARSIETSPCFSPNDRNIVYTSDRAGIPNIYIMDAGGSNSRRLTYGGQYYESPSWSSCGNYIAFVSMNYGRFDVFAMNIDGSSPRRLTHLQGSNEDPSFSPRGRLIVYSSKEKGSIRLFLTNTEAEFNIPITDNNMNIIQPHWK